MSISWLIFLGLVQYENMITTDKYKKNRFRKLIPTSNSYADRLERLATIEPNSTAFSQASLTDSSKQVERISANHVLSRSKERQQHIERRIKTISSINEKQEKQQKLSSSALGLYEGQQIKRYGKGSKAGDLIEQFFKNIEKTLKATTVQELGYFQQKQQASKFEQALEQLTQRTKLSAAKLLFNYLRALGVLSEREGWLRLISYTNKADQNNQNEITFMQQYQQSQLMLKKREGQRKRQKGDRSNLMNVSKFFSST